MTSRTGWGVAIIGHPTDLAIYAGALKMPFDPWVKRHGEEFVLRSSAFDGSQSGLEARERAAALVEELNGALAISHDARAVTVAGVVQFGADGSMHRTAILEPASFEIRGSTFSKQV